MAENCMILDNHLLLCVEDHDLSTKKDILDEYAYLKSHFCGRVVCLRKSTSTPTFVKPRGTLYVCGNIKVVYDKIKTITQNVKVIKEFTNDVEGMFDLEYVSLGEVPINLHNVAVYYRDCLGFDNKNYFDALQTKHTFQALTESNKPGLSYRKGIYLSEVANIGNASDFNILRCSTNLSGPTLAFADEDREILGLINELARQNFEQETELNHVLAQIYQNTVTTDDLNRVKEHKAKIKSHSDKTKDMPANGLIAFVTFYSSDIKTYKEKPNDRFNRHFKDGSVLTQLRFKLKSDVSHLPLSKEFRVTLYPNSVLLIPLDEPTLHPRNCAAYSTRW